jgi:peptidoglycan/LPS O-acetylase OafA/YrhL
MLSAVILFYGAVSMMFGLTLAEGGLAYGWDARIIGLLFFFAGGWLFSFSCWVELRKRGMQVTSRVLAILFFVGMVIYLYVKLRA